MKGNNIIYFDNAATTKPAEYLINLYKRYTTEYWFNPSAIYKDGLKVKEEIELTREYIGEIFNVNPSTIFFTFSGTYGNNLVINGFKTKIKNPNIIASRIDHSSIIEPLMNVNRNFNVRFVDFRFIYNLIKEFLKENLKKENEKVDELKKDNILENFNKNKDTLVKKYKKLIEDKIIESYLKLVDSNTALVVISHVHNETGFILPVCSIIEKIKIQYPEVKVLVDSTQAMLKINLDKKLFKLADFIVFSSHKFYCPRGAGILYIKSQNILEPLLYGGGQEYGITPSTENTFAIISIKEVLQNEFNNLLSYKNYVYNLKKQLFNLLNREFKDRIFFFSAIDEIFSPYINRVYIRNTKGEVIVNALSMEKIYISTGSACFSRKKHRFSDQDKFGIPENLIEGNLRISFAKYNTIQEIEIFVEKLKKVVDQYFF